MINHLVNQRYEVLEKVGDSPLFTVYKARDRQMSRMVALKTVQPAYADDQDFLTELQMGLAETTNLNHPNITRFQEFGAEDGVPYASFEFVRGINLKERIRRIAPFTLSVAVDFACAIAEALHYAHSLKQVHGDLRPQNIIISPEGAVKITDFGVQKAIARSSRAQDEILIRAAPYHAPELSMRQAGTPAGDIYGMGAVLYEMLTGAPLYAGSSPEAVADQHAFAAIPLPRALNTGVPRSVEGILLKCLQKKPGERYANAADLLNDLKSVRDALRFGKPLSWSPVDIEKLAAAPVRPVVAPPAAETTARPAARNVERGAAIIPAAAETAPSARSQRPEPVADVAASSQAVSMPAKNRLRAEDERVSIYLKVAIATVTAVILGTLIVFAGVWVSLWAVGKPIEVPQMVGKTIEDVRDLAKVKNVRLIEHAEFSDKPRDIVYKTDPKSGDQIRPHRSLSVWYSKGPIYVNVPNLVNLQKEEAEQRLKDAGLTLGKEITEFSDKVILNAVVSQDVSWKKRVLHDTPVDLIISDGPKPDYATDNGDAGAGGTTDPGTGTNPNPNPPGANDPNTPPPADPNEAAALPDQENHTFDRPISIPKDGKGVRKVKIEYVDSQNLPIPVIDEDHKEGDKIPVRFDYSGKNITLRIYYDDNLVWERKFDPQATKNKRIQ